MSLERGSGRHHPSTSDQAGPRVGVVSEVGIRDGPGVAARPARVGSVGDAVERLGWEVVAHQVAAVGGGPRRTGLGVDRDADRIAKPSHVDARVAAIAHLR